MRPSVFGGQPAHHEKCLARIGIGELGRITLPSGRDLVDQFRCPGTQAPSEGGQRSGAEERMQHAAETGMLLSRTAGEWHLSEGRAEQVNRKGFRRRRKGLRIEQRRSHVVPAGEIVAMQRRVAGVYFHHRSEFAKVAPVSRAVCCEERTLLMVQRRRSHGAISRHVFVGHRFVNLQPDCWDISVNLRR